MEQKKIRGLGVSKTFSGKLFVVEGCDGAGKSTQIYLLKKWLDSQGYIVFFTQWNSSVLTSGAIKKAKKDNLLTPTTFSLVHASDFADRYEKLILPHLRAGYIVLCDRYIYTAYARDIARGCDPNWVRNVYDFAVKPTATFYFKVPLAISIKRILNGRTQLKYHEAGLDMGFSKDPLESFQIFQGMVKKNYDDMSKKEGFITLDASKSIVEQQKIIRNYVTNKLTGYISPYTKKSKNEVIL
jgi:dTMP kinase